MHRVFVNLFLVFSTMVFTLHVARAQAPSSEQVDTSVVRKIWEEGTERSQVMDILHYLTDVCGPRLTGSPQYMKAATWSMSKLRAWGVSNVHLDGWGPFGRSWTLKRFNAQVLSPDVFPLLAYPRAWSPGTKGTVQGDAIFFDATTDSALQTFRGRLRGKFVLMEDARQLQPQFEPRARRFSDSTLLEMANADYSPLRRFRRGEMTPEARANAMLALKKLQMMVDEGAAALLAPSRADGGVIFVLQAAVPTHPDTPFTRRPQPWRVDAPPTVPQVAVAAEHYNRLVRLLKRGERVRIEMTLEVSFPRADSAYNVIGEIPGSDLADEVVMIGAHLDSWHVGTGATDNATGSAVCLEAMRILKALDLKPRRTIRIGLWAGEEQGLLGSQAYVRKHFGWQNDTTQAPTLTPQGEKFCVYFNDDNGTGRFRGVYLQGNEAARPIFRRWLTAIGDPTAQTLTLRSTGSTDHVSFDRIGLPAFQFIQDQIEYSTLTHHSTMDVADRVVPKDLQQSAVIMAIFAYNAAMRDQPIPRRPR
ncbi:MAG TPA: M20/M25/M40 family metallo-hydrolase [Bacteroidota bacterium]|nr:M20/M25/M40 family metallo-hydrolase [Bacteroidota bacterium]